MGQLIAECPQQHGWGKAVVETLAHDLQTKFAGVSGFSVQNLWYMRQFYLEYSANELLQPLVGEISWAKHLLIMACCKDPIGEIPSTVAIRDGLLPQSPGSIDASGVEYPGDR